MTILDVRCEFLSKAKAMTGCMCHFNNLSNHCDAHDCVEYRFMDRNIDLFTIIERLDRTLDIFNSYNFNYIYKIYTINITYIVLLYTNIILYNYYYIYYNFNLYFF